MAMMNPKTPPPLPVKMKRPLWKDAGKAELTPTTPAQKEAMSLSSECRSLEDNNNNNIGVGSKNDKGIIEKTANNVVKIRVESARLGPRDDEDAATPRESVKPSRAVRINITSSEQTCPNPDTDAFSQKTSIVRIASQEFCEPPPLPVKKKHLRFKNDGEKLASGQHSPDSGNSSDIERVSPPVQQWNAKPTEKSKVDSNSSLSNGNLNSLSNGSGSWESGRLSDEDDLSYDSLNSCESGSLEDKFQSKLGDKLSQLRDAHLRTLIHNHQNQELDEIGTGSGVLGFTAGPKQSFEDLPVVQLSVEERDSERSSEDQSSHESFEDAVSEQESEDGIYQNLENPAPSRSSKEKTAEESFGDACDVSRRFKEELPGADCVNRVFQSSESGVLNQSFKDRSPQICEDKVAQQSFKDKVSESNSEDEIYQNLEIGDSQQNIKDRVPKSNVVSGDSRLIAEASHQSFKNELSWSFQNRVSQQGSKNIDSESNCENRNSRNLGDAVSQQNFQVDVSDSNFKNKNSGCFRDTGPQQNLEGETSTLNSVNEVCQQSFNVDVLLSTCKNAPSLELHDRDPQRNFRGFSQSSKNQAPQRCLKDKISTSNLENELSRSFQSRVSHRSSKDEATDPNYDRICQQSFKDKVHNPSSELAKGAQNRPQQPRDGICQSFKDEVPRSFQDRVSHRNFKDCALSSESGVSARSLGSRKGRLLGDRASGSAGRNFANARSGKQPMKSGDGGETPNAREDNEADAFDANKYFNFHLSETNFDKAREGGDEEDDYFDTFAGCNHFSGCDYSTESPTIRSSKGTIRGVKNRVRAGIATFLQIPANKNWAEKEVGKVVVYTTSMGIIRETYQRCLKVRQILRTHLVKFEERDIAGSREVLAEIKDRMNSKQILVPQVFVEGQHIGDAETIDRLNESGELRRILKPYRSPDTCNICQVCGGYQLLPCALCSGSKKSVHRNQFTAELVSLKCVYCDEVGLVKCYACTL